MNKINWINLAYWFLITIVVIFIFLIVVYVNNESASCIKQPFVFGASKMGNVECSCMQFHDNKLPASFKFNDTSFIINNERR